MATVVKERKKVREKDSKESGMEVVPGAIPSGARKSDADLASTCSEVEVMVSADEYGRRLRPGGGMVDFTALKVRKDVRKKRKADSRKASGSESAGDKCSGYAEDGGSSGCMGRTKAITNSLLGIVYREGVGTEAVIMSLIAEVERARGKLSVYELVGSKGIGAVAEPTVTSATVRAPGVVPAPCAVPASAPAPVVPKPVETRAVVVKGKGKDREASKEVVKKVVEKVGGAIIRMPSVAKRGRVRSNAKFGELGLEVSVQDKLGPRVVVQGVQGEITVDDFMKDLYEMNLKDRMSKEKFDKSVKVVGGAWKPDQGPVNVILEGTEAAISPLLGVGRCYIKWFSFRVREYELVPGCYRCRGFDHRVRECKFKKDVCRRCGQEGHVATRCGNAVHCRNCALKGVRSDHMMQSMECPMYAMLVARVFSIELSGVVGGDV